VEAENRIKRDKSVTPCDFLPCSQQRLEYGVSYTGHLPLAISPRFRDRTETIRLLTHTLDLLPPKYFVAVLHIAEVEVRDPAGKYQQRSL
jgi:hypothetical protein